MLITCSKCGKIYDYDKYHGICPKCARYNSEKTAEEEHQAYHDQYDGGYDHSEEAGHHAYHEKYDDVSAVHPDHAAGMGGKLAKIKGMDKKSKLVLIIIAIVFGVNFVLPFLFVILELLFFWM